MPELKELPVDILHNIMQSLSLYEMVQLRGINTRFNQLLLDIEVNDLLPYIRSSMDLDAIISLPQFDNTKVSAVLANQHISNIHSVSIIKLSNLANSAQELDAIIVLAKFNHISADAVLNNRNIDMINAASISKLWSTVVNNYRSELANIFLLPEFDYNEELQLTSNYASKLDHIISLPNFFQEEHDGLSLEISLLGKLSQDSLIKLLKFVNIVYLDTIVASIDWSGSANFNYVLDSIIAHPKFAELAQSNIHLILGCTFLNSYHINSLIGLSNFDNMACTLVIMRGNCGINYEISSLNKLLLLANNVSELESIVLLEGFDNSCMEALLSNPHIEEIADPEVLCKLNQLGYSKDLDIEGSMTAASYSTPRPRF